MIDESVTIIGTGALGSSLATALNEKGIEIYSLFNRSSRNLDELKKAINPKHSGSFPEELGHLGDVIFITIADSSILSAAKGLADLSENYSNRLIIHCSGSEPSAVLSILKKKGASAASFHPVQTFTVQSKPDDFRNIYFDIEGDEKAVTFLKKLTEILDANYIEISPEAKPYLHAAGVMASNYFFALMEASATIAAMGDIERNKAIKALLPLAYKTIENALSAEQFSGALSGPIARGDVETVAKHLELLRENPKIYRLYKDLGEETLKLAKQNERLPKNKVSQFVNLFDSSGD